MVQWSDQLVLNYLAKVATAAQEHLPPLRRTEYVTEVRRRIEKRLAAAGARDSEQVRAVLDEFGEAAELVARECGPKDSAEEPVPSSSGAEGAGEPGRGRESRRKLGVLARPARLRRAPPPWEGGPRRTRLYTRGSDAPESAESAGVPRREGRTFGTHPGVVFVRLMYAARRHPVDVAGIGLSLLTGLIGFLTFLWPLVALQVLLSRVWRTWDKWAAIGGPVAASAVGMAMWTPDQEWIYWDQYLVSSFPEMGVPGLRIAAVAVFFYLAVRMSHIVAVKRG